MQESVCGMLCSNERSNDVLSGRDEAKKINFLVFTLCKRFERSLVLNYLHVYIVFFDSMALFPKRLLIPTISHEF
jgi:hypothetical protein